MWMLLRKVRIPAEGGGEKPLVKSERVVWKADRPPKPDRPPSYVMPFLIAGVVVGGTTNTRCARKSEPLGVATTTSVP